MAITTLHECVQIRDSIDKCNGDERVELFNQINGRLDCGSGVHLNYKVVKIIMPWYFQISIVFESLVKALDKL